MDHPVCLVYCPLLPRPGFSGKKYLIPSNHPLTRETERKTVQFLKTSTLDWQNWPRHQNCQVPSVNLIISPVREKFEGMREFIFQKIRFLVHLCTPPTYVRAFSEGWHFALCSVPPKNLINVVELWAFIQKLQLGRSHALTLVAPVRVIVPKAICLFDDPSFDQLQTNGQSLCIVGKSYFSTKLVNLFRN
jgi:hypothetical protein